MTGLEAVSNMLLHGETLRVLLRSIKLLLVSINTIRAAVMSLPFPVGNVVFHRTHPLSNAPRFVTSLVPKREAQLL